MLDQDLDGDDEGTRRRKAASQTKSTCPGCRLNAWAKPEARLVCGVCGEAMSPETADADAEAEAD